MINHLETKIEFNKPYKYSIVCDVFEEPKKTGKAKQLQVTNWKRFYNIIDGEKATFIFTERYETPIEKIDNRGKSEGSRGHNNKYGKHIDIILYDYFYNCNKYIIYKTTNQLACESCLININYSTAFSNKNKYYKYTCIQTQEGNISAMYDFFGVVKGSIKDLIRSSLDRLKKQNLIIYEERYMLIYNGKARHSTDTEMELIKNIEVDVLKDMGIDNKNKLQYNDKLRNEYYKNIEKIVCQEIENVESLFMGYKIIVLKENFRPHDNYIVHEKNILNELFIKNVLEKLRKIKNKIEAEYIPWIENSIGKPKPMEFLDKYIADRLNINYIFYTEFVIKSLLNKECSDIRDIIKNIKINSKKQHEEPIDFDNMTTEEKLKVYNSAEDEFTRDIIKDFYLNDIDIPY